MATRARLVDLTVEEPAIEDIVRHMYEHGAAGSPSAATP